MRTYLSYAGRFEVLAEQNTVVHHIEVSSYPNWAGVAQPRTARFDGDVLTLTTRSPSAPERTAEAVWERVGHDQPMNKTA